LGAGKTSLLNHILLNKEGLKVAVIVNDMSEVNIDAQLVKKENTLSRTEERLVEMSIGCICCTLCEDLMVEVEKLAKENRFDYLLIESTGISEPIPVAQTFSFESEDGSFDLSRFSYIDTMVTVVDGYNFLKDFSSQDYLTSSNLTEIENDTRTIVNLLTDQVEFANVIVLNKTDLITEDQLKQLYGILQKLNPKARIVPAINSQIPVTEIIGTNLYNFEEAENSAGWIQELENEHTPVTEEYGIGSMVFRSTKPFHPERFWNFATSGFPANFIRSKGLFWLASRPSQALIWSSAGGSPKTYSAGVWWASMPFSERINNAAFGDNQASIESDWHPEFGDRKNELVFIAQDLDKEKLINLLEDCLLREVEQNLWKKQKLQLIDHRPIETLEYTKHLKFRTQYLWVPEKQHIA